MPSASEKGPPPVQKQNPRPSTSIFSTLGAGATVKLAAPLALAFVLSGGCGSGGSQSNPDLPDVVIDPVSQFVDVGARYFLDGSGSTDPDGNAEDLEFQWRLISGGSDDTDFDDHCREDFDEICSSNDDDHCSNDTDRLCNTDDDCVDFGTCLLNSGTTSSECTEGLCGLGEGDEGAMATLVADVAGPYSVRLTAIGQKANGTKTIVLDTYPSLYVVGSLFQFGGTEGLLVGEVADAAEFAAGASEGAGNPADGNLLLIDDVLGVVRLFDLRSGAILGAFGESDRFVNNPAALAFHPDNGRLYVAQQDGEVKVFDGTTGLLITTFGNVGANPISMRFSPTSGDLLVVDGVAGSGVRAFGSDGVSNGVLGDTDSAVTEAVDLDFLGDPATALLVADRTGRVVRCDTDGTDCGVFSAEADDLLEAGSPSAIAVNPSSGESDTDADVLIADPVGERVIACDAAGDCGTFGETDEIDSDYEDVFFAPTSAPTTTTTVTSTTSTTLKN